MGLMEIYPSFVIFEVEMIYANTFIRSRNASPKMYMVNSGAV